MRKTQIIGIVTVTLLLFTACGSSDSNQNNSSKSNSNGELHLPMLEEEQIVKELPANFPDGIPYLEGYSETDLYHDTDTSNGNMVFYTTETSVEDAYNYYVNALKENGWTLTLYKLQNKNSAFVDFQKGDQMCNIYFSGIIPKIYPESLNLSGTFIAIRYNMKPLPEITTE